MKWLKEWEEQAKEQASRLSIACSRIAEEKASLRNAQASLAQQEEAQQILQTVAQTVQQQAHDRIAGVVSRCLAAVFPDPYTFQILFEKKRGKTEARLVFIRNGEEYLPREVGGSCRQLAGFALQLACLMIHQPSVRRLMIMDEPFLALDAQKIHRVRALIEQLADELDMQFLIVTHDEDLECGNIIPL